jgi:hypothetical protein
VDVISFSDTDSTNDLREYVVVLTHGKEHVNIVAQASIPELASATLVNFLDKSVIEELKKIYDPLGERIKSRKIDKGKSGGGTARVKKSRNIVVPDPDSDRDKESVLVQTGSDVNNRALV